MLTYQGAFVLTRVFHLLKNAAGYFQSTKPSHFGQIRHHVKVWIDNFTVHASAVTELSESLDIFFRIWDRKILGLCAKRFIFWKWCDRIRDVKGKIACWKTPPCANFLIALNISMRSCPSKTGWGKKLGSLFQKTSVAYACSQRFRRSSGQL